MALRLPAAQAAQVAFDSIGRGYDLTNDLSLKYCKGDSIHSRLIQIDEVGGHDIVVPGGVSIVNVSKSIKCKKGDKIRFRSEVLSFNQMSEQFNQDLSLIGKIPYGLFNTMFEFSGCWQRDLAYTKSLAFDGVFVSLYTASLDPSTVVSYDHVKEALPTSWKPDALARFIKTYGTHIIVGVEMGGKDVIYVKQHRTSSLQLADVERRLKDRADKKFLDANGQDSAVSEKINSIDEDLVCLYKRRGGSDIKNLPHNEWLDSIHLQPDVISMSFLPITSLVSGIPGCAFLTHAVNLYQQYKPPVEGLQQFFEFHQDKQWAPIYGELLFARQTKKKNLFLQFKFLGPKLYVNSSQVDVGHRPVTGLRLLIEGNRSNRLAICMEHLASLPMNFHLTDDPDGNFREDFYDPKFYEKVQWRWFSHVCTAPVESIKEESIVSGAQLLVESHGQKSILFLRLNFSVVAEARVVSPPEWDGPVDMAASLSFELEKKEESKKEGTGTFASSAVYPGGPLVPNRAPKMLKLVNTTEIRRGLADSPGYWVVSGARLVIDEGKISLRVKYSLLTCSPTIANIRNP